MNRIEPSKVPDLFRELDIRPIRLSYLSKEDGRRGQCLACLVGVLASKAVSFDKAFASEGHNARDLGQLADLDPCYARGLSDGWEGLSARTWPDYNDEAFKLGYHDGKKAYNACVAAGLTVEYYV